MKKHMLSQPQVIHSVTLTLLHHWLSRIRDAPRTPKSQWGLFKDRRWTYAFTHGAHGGDLPESLAFLTVVPSI